MLTRRIKHFYQIRVHALLRLPTYLYLPVTWQTIEFTYASLGVLSISVMIVNLVARILVIQSWLSSVYQRDKKFSFVYIYLLFFTVFTPYYTTTSMQEHTDPLYYGPQKHRMLTSSNVANKIVDMTFDQNSNKKSQTGESVEIGYVCCWKDLPPLASNPQINRYVDQPMQ